MHAKMVFLEVGLPAEMTDMQPGAETTDMQEEPSGAQEEGRRATPGHAAAGAAATGASAAGLGTELEAEEHEGRAERRAERLLATLTSQRAERLALEERVRGLGHRLEQCASRLHAE